MNTLTPKARNAVSKLLGRLATDGAKRSVYRLVRRVDRSPMNPLRWCLELECGHEEWVTSKRKPTNKTRQCPPCEGIAANTPNAEIRPGGPDAK